MSLRKSLNKLLLGTHCNIVKINPALNCEPNHNIKINIEYFLAKELIDNKNFFFIQIGAIDAS